MAMTSWMFWLLSNVHEVYFNLENDEIFPEKKIFDLIFLIQNLPPSLFGK